MTTFVWLLVACAPTTTSWSVVVTHLEAGDLRTYDGETGALVSTWRPDDREAWQPAAGIITADGGNSHRIRDLLLPHQELSIIAQTVNLVEHHDAPGGCPVLIFAVRG